MSPDKSSDNEHKPPCEPLIRHVTEKNSVFSDLRFWITIIVICIGWAVSAGIISQKVEMNIIRVNKMEEDYKNIPERLAKFEVDMSYVREGIAEIKDDVKFMKKQGMQ